MKKENCKQRANAERGSDKKSMKNPFFNYFTIIIKSILTRSRIVFQRKKGSKFLQMPTVRLGVAPPRVAKCHRYGRYVCVKILEGWGKKCSFSKLIAIGKWTNANDECQTR